MLVMIFWSQFYYFAVPDHLCFCCLEFHSFTHSILETEDEFFSNKAEVSIEKELLRNLAFAGVVKYCYFWAFPVLSIFWRVLNGSFSFPERNALTLLLLIGIKISILDNTLSQSIPSEVYIANNNSCFLLLDCEAVRSTLCIHFYWKSIDPIIFSQQFSYESIVPVHLPTLLVISNCCKLERKSEEGELWSDDFVEFVQDDCLG